MRVSEISGALLDYWVGRSVGLGEIDGLRIAFGKCWCAEINDADQFIQDQFYTPSTDWNEGGFIIQNARIAICFEDDKWHAELVHSALEDGRQLSFACGETPLIAAMRAYVCSRFGEEVPEIE